MPKAATLLWVPCTQSEDAEQDAEEQRPRQDQELGMRKSSRTEHVDFKMKEDER